MKTTFGVLGGIEREAQRNSRVWLCSAQLVCIFFCLSTCVIEVKISFSSIFCVGYIFRTGDVRALMYFGASSLYNSLTSSAQLASEPALDKSQKGLTFRFCDVHLLQSKGQIIFLKIIPNMEGRIGNLKLK
jgi:hypothetical protein